jgi:hypothetical protein
MFIDRERKRRGTPLGVRCSECTDETQFIFSTIQEQQVAHRGHRTPKGVRNSGTLENCKHGTPPE